MRKIHDVPRLSAAGMSKLQTQDRRRLRGERDARRGASGGRRGSRLACRKGLTEEALRCRLYPPPAVTAQGSSATGGLGGNPS